MSHSLLYHFQLSFKAAEKINRLKTGPKSCSEELFILHCDNMMAGAHLA